MKKDVARRLADSVFEVDTAPIEYIKPERKRNVVGYPYAGPELVWAKDIPVVELDLEASDVSETRSCLSCGDIRYTLCETEIVTRECDWSNHHIFRIATNGPAIPFVTERGRSVIEGCSFTNIHFREAGEIV